MKLSPLPLVLVTASMMLAACGGSGAVASAPNTLTAVKVDAVSADAAAAIWSNAPKMTVTTRDVKKGGTATAAITMQAVYDGSNIAFRAEWADTTDSWQRSVWSYDGTSWKRGGDQDRLSLAFSMSNNAAFASKGCGAICHNQDTDETKWWMGTDTADVKIDMWQWQSAATNPAGYDDDGWWGTKPLITSTTGRADDKNTGGGPVANNAIAGNTKDGGPAFVNVSGTDAHYILAGQQAPIDMSKIKAGAIIPGSILAPYTGSRGDVAAKGTYTDGKWVVVLTRALNTGNSDDAVLIPSKQMPFGVALFNNAGDVNHTVAPDVLTLAWK
ncbi:MAG TPA: ethylbenzene dehydrogenase-related protein [Anaerolineae bacterium]